MNISLPDKFEEFSESRRNGFLEVKKLKDEGAHIIGVYCTFFPSEIATAMGLYTVSLCAFSGETIPAAEQVLPANLCPLIKSSYGFASTDKCPYFYFSDLVVGETTCDGKKKMYELMSEFKDVHVMKLPNTRSEAAVKLWRQEIIELKNRLEDMFGITLEPDALRRAIHDKNEERRALLRFAHIMELEPPPVSSSDGYNVLYGSSFNLDKQALVRDIDAMADRILEEYDPDCHESRPRILITGCPIGGDTEKIIEAVEECGGVVVAYENCGGEKTLSEPVDENDPDMFYALAVKYLNIGCSCISPNTKRFELLGSMIDQYKVDGVIDVVLHACLTYSVESGMVRRYCRDEKGVLCMTVETDYSDTDRAQLGTRIAAFIEMLQEA